MSASPSERDIARELRLRAAPAPVVRLSRKVLVGLGAVSSLAVLGAVAWSLAEKPHGKGQSEVYQTGEQRPPDAMAALPADYASPGAAGAPKLGPPLPGDLGPPMLAAGQTSTSPISGAGGSSASSSAQQRAEDLQAARASRLFSIDGRAAGGETGEVAEPSLPIPAQPPQAVIPGLRSAEHVEATLPVTISGQQSTSADRIEAPISPYVLQAGSVIPAALLTGLRSDLAGEIAAQVTENVFDSPTGRYLLIPQGSRLIGRYASQVAFGQSRVLLDFTRLILPDGKSIALQNEPGADVSGYSGLEDRVDRHAGQLLDAALVSTILGVGAQAGAGPAESQLLQALRQGGANALNQAGQQVVAKGLGVQPTLTIRPGFPLRVIVTRDLVLAP